MAIRAPDGANNWFKIFRGHKILTKLSKLCMDLWWNPYLSVPFPKVQKYEKYLNEPTATNDFKSWRKTNSCMNHFLFKLLMFRLHINVCQISWWCLCPFILCFPEQNDNTSYILMRKKRRTRRPCLSGLSEHLLPTKGLVISRLALPFLPGLLSHSYYAPIKRWKWCFPQGSKITISFLTWFNWLGFRDAVKNYLADFFR